MRRLFAALLLIASFGALGQSTVTTNPYATGIGADLSGSAVSGTLPVTKGGSGLTAAVTGLLLGNGSGYAAYAGTSCTTQFPRSLNASGVATCATIAVADIATALNAGGNPITGTTITASTRVITAAGSNSAPSVRVGSAEQGLYDGGSNTVGLSIAGANAHLFGSTGHSILHNSACFNGGAGSDFQLCRYGATGSLRVTGTAPSISACGTGATVAGSNTSMRIAVGTGSPTSCVVTFSGTWTAAPNCIAQSDTDNSLLVTRTTTTVTVTRSAAAAFTDSTAVTVHCLAG